MSGHLRSDDDRRRTSNIHLLPNSIKNVQRFEKISLFSSEFIIQNLSCQNNWKYVILPNSERITENKVRNETATKWEIKHKFMWFMDRLEATRITEQPMLVQNLVHSQRGKNKVSTENMRSLTHKQKRQIVSSCSGFYIINWNKIDQKVVNRLMWEMIWIILFSVTKSYSAVFDSPWMNGKQKRKKQIDIDSFCS